MWCHDVLEKGTQEYVVTTIPPDHNRIWVGSKATSFLLTSGTFQTLPYLVLYGAV